MLIGGVIKAIQLWQISWMEKSLIVLAREHHEEAFSLAFSNLTDQGEALASNTL